MKRGMRLGLRTLVPLFLCAAAGAAAAAHVAIDVVGDYALPTDTYDHLAHTSRNLVAGLALSAAILIAVRGLRACCDVAVANRGRLIGPNLGKRTIAAFVAAVVAFAGMLVPAMELLDARLDGAPLDGLDAAFGGSTLLGVAVTVACAAVVAGIVLALAAWIVAHRDVIETMVVSLLGRANSATCKNASALRRRFSRTRRPVAVGALQLCKRGPPNIARVPYRQYFTRNSEGDPRALRLFARVTNAARIRNRAYSGGTRLCRRPIAGGDAARQH